MHSLARTMQASVSTAEPMPDIPELADLFSVWTPRRGQIVMIAGRSGTLKSGFAMFLCAMWNRPTLYFSGDMSMHDSAIRFASILTERSSALIHEDMKDEARREALMRRLHGLHIGLVPESPITFRGIGHELEAFVEMHDAWPEVIVIDNFMDIAGNEADYQSQMESFQELTAMARHTGATLLVLHHATDKSRSAEGVEWTTPPARSEIKNGMAEKPEVVLTVAVDLNANRYQVAVVKQRMGRSDPSALNPVSLQVVPEHFRFGRWAL